MSSPVKHADSDPLNDGEPLNERNWHKKMRAAMMAYDRRREHWRTHFTREELEIIDREFEPEIQWALKAEMYDLPGPRRVAVMG